MILKPALVGSFKDEAVIPGVDLAGRGLLQFTYFLFHTHAGDALRRRVDLIDPVWARFSG